MANLATVAGPTAGGTSKSSEGQPQSQQTGAMRPFIRAAINHREAAGYDVSVPITASTQNLPDILVPAYGYIRAVRLVVTTSGGAASVAPTAFAGNGLFDSLQNIIVQEPNGAQIHNFPTAWWLFLTNKYGGYTGYSDPRALRNYSSALTTTPGFSYTLRIPFELNNRDALGCLPNQNSAAQFRIKLQLASLTQIFTGGTWTTNPTVRIRAYIEAWDQPEASTNGQPNQTTPPAMNTTQFWSVQQFPVNAGTQNIKLTRVGNYIRNLIFVYTDTNGSRQTANAQWPDPATLYYDTRPLDIVDRIEWDGQIYERYGYLGNQAVSSYEGVGGLDYGVFPMDFCHEFDGTVGHENRDQWLPTLSSTRLELGGNWGVAGTLSVLTNDVVTVGNVFL